MSNSYAGTGSAGSLNPRQSAALSGQQADLRHEAAYQSQTSQPRRRQDDNAVQGPAFSPTMTPGLPSSPLPSSSRQAEAAYPDTANSGGLHPVTRPSPSPSPNPNPNPNLGVMDRKRRLTGSAYEQTRRRYPSDNSLARHESLHRDHRSSAPALALRQTRSNEPSLPQGREVVDLTASSPPPSNKPSSSGQRPSRTSSSSSGGGQYVVPQWQPDSEVTECPICERPFTWIFRRHHCRKCGRVVCNDCSPHRITIPRQLIVSPPGPETNQSSSEANEIIDLTGEDDDFNAPLGRARTSSNLLLDGGEKVRLCNPCVPDPQPEPFPNLSSVGAEERGTASSPRILSYGSALPFAANNRAFERPRAPGHRDTSSSLPGSATPFTTRHRPGFAPTPYALPHPSSSSAREDGARMFHNPFPPVPRLVQLRPSHGHGRYASLDSSNPLTQPNLMTRPRMSSLNEGATYPSQPPHIGVLQPPAAMERQGINEDDICPVCHRVLPEQGSNGDESAREAHIMACISAREPEGSSEAGSSSRGTLHMISFTASEKDCVAGDGNPQECSICMEEYNVGDELARLECWCKFHKHCIMSWLGKKAECPVHKMAAIHLTQD